MTAENSILSQAVLLPVLSFFSPLCVCCFSIVETKGTRGRCGGAWAQPCSASCLTGASTPEEAEAEAEVERDGGEVAAAAAWGGKEGSCLTPLHFSEDLDSARHCLIQHGSVFFIWEKKTKESPRDGDKPNFYTRSRAFFLRFPKKAPRCSEILRRDNVDILIKVWCCRRVQYIVHVWFFCTSNIYLTPMASADPGNALFNVFCQNEYFWNCWQERLDSPPSVFQHLIKPFTIFSFQRGNFSEQETYCAVDQLTTLIIFFLLLSVFVFLPLNFIGYGDKLEHDPLVSFQIVVGKKISSHRAGRQFVNTQPVFIDKPFFSAVLHVKQLKMLCWRQHSGWSVQEEFALLVDRLLLTKQGENEERSWLKQNW